MLKDKSRFKTTITLKSIDKEYNHSKTRPSQQPNYFLIEKIR